MILFLLTFFIVYGGLHLYVFSKIKGAFPLPPVANICLMLLLVFMLLAPLLIRLSERYGYESSAALLSYIGYIWMGIVLLFFTVSILFDLYRLLIFTGAHIFNKDLSSLKPSPLFLLIVPLVISLSLNAYGYFEAKNIRTEQITITTPKLPREIGRLRIVQISDVHVGLIIRGERLKRMMEKVRKAEPDILVSTGDLVDGQMNNLSQPAGLLRDIHPKYGKFAITGNHEFYAGIDHALEFHRRAGFLVLRGEAVTLPGLINIAGVDDRDGKRFGLYTNVPEKTLLANLPGKYFTLLLKHRPILDGEAFGLYDLQLSGHTHKGQIYPFSLVTKYIFPYHTGYFQLPKGSRLYVSRGTGTWGPPIRFLSPPEVTVIDLVHQEEGKI